MCSRFLLNVAAVALAIAAASLPAHAGPGPHPVATAAWVGDTALLTRDEALKLAFPECEVKRRTAYLDEAQRKRIAKLAKVDFDAGVVYPYVATKKGKLVGTAYFDAHKVRTKREVLMVVVTPEEKIARVEVLSFAEPKEYLPRAKWYEQFRDRKLDKDLSLKRKIRGVTGATLTARATTDAARRMLAVHQVLQEAAKKKEADEKKKKKKKTEEEKRTGSGSSGASKRATGR